MAALSEKPSNTMSTAASNSNQRLAFRRKKRNISVPSNMPLRPCHGANVQGTTWRGFLTPQRVCSCTSNPHKIQLLSPLTRVSLIYSRVTAVLPIRICRMNGGFCGSIPDQAVLFDPNHAGGNREGTHQPGRQIQATTPASREHAIHGWRRHQIVCSSVDSRGIYAQPHAEGLQQSLLSRPQRQQRRF